MTSEHDIPPEIRRACRDHAALPSAMAGPVADALTAIAELQRIAAVMAPLVPLVPRLERVATVLEIAAGLKRCPCAEPRPVALAAGFICTECGGRCEASAGPQRRCQVCGGGTCEVGRCIQETGRPA